MVFVGRRRKTVRALVPGQGAWDGGGGGGITDRNPQREKEGARERRGGRAGGSEEVGGGARHSCQFSRSLALSPFTSEAWLHPGDSTIGF